MINVRSPGRPSLPTSSSEAGLTQRDYLAIGLCAGSFFIITILLQVYKITARLPGAALHVRDGRAGRDEEEAEARPSSQGAVPQHAAANGPSR